MLIDILPDILPSKDKTKVSETLLQIYNKELNLGHKCVLIHKDLIQ